MSTRVLLPWLVLLGLHGAGASAQQTTTVRGRIDRVGADNHPRPVAYLSVTLRARDTGQRTDPSYTGQDGMYYVYAVKPGPYYLEVKVLPSGPPFIYQIDARAQTYTDIAPIVLP